MINSRVKNLYLIIILITALIICGTRFSFSYAILISYGFFALLIAGFIFLAGRLKLALSLSSSMIITLQLLNQIKVHYYKERLFFPDIAISLDPNNFDTLLQYPAALLALVGLLVFLIFNTVIFISSAKIAMRYRLLFLPIAIVLGFGLTGISQNKENIHRWQADLPKGKSTITNLFMSAQKMFYSPPSYEESADYFLNAQAETVYPANQYRLKPDIIVLLQESTLDPRLYDTGALKLPTLTMFANAPASKMGGALRVQTFGGGTWLSEFSLLTGLNTDDFQFRKNSVFYTVAPHIKTSLFNEMKNNGYYTVVLTPMHAGTYNAGETYRNLGIDLILQPQDLGYPADKQRNLWTIPSLDMLNYAKQIVEKFTDKPLFLFVLTMAEHGPYGNSYSDALGVDKLIKNKESVALFNSYFSRLQLLNQATENFTDYMVNRNKPFMFLYFGDHQPNAGWNGGYNTPLPRPDYLTQFYLRDNLDGTPADKSNEITDIAFLGGILLERAELSVSPFYAANIKMRHLCQGKLDECENQQLVNSYKHYIYQDVKNAGESEEK